MQNAEMGGGKGQGDGEISSPSSDLSSNDGEDNGGRPRGELGSQQGRGSAAGGNDASAAAAAAPAQTVLSILISQPEEAVVLKAAPPKSIIMGIAADKDEKVVAMTPTKKGISRSDSYHEQCRVCQQQSDEPLMDLGCRCRGELAKAHLSCIEIWFRTRGSNKCEICQQVAANVPSPETQPSTNYWIWRVDPAFGGPNTGRTDRERGCFSPLWVAFCILIGGLLLDVLISVSLGVSALPVNIIIGVLIVLGLGTAIRLALECCHEWSTRRNVQRAADTAVNSGRHLDV